MKLISIILGLGCFLLKPALTLQLTQDQAHQFLIDNGQVTKDSVVQSFTLDRNGQVRLRLSEGDFVYNFGLEEDQDTYSISFMNKKKQVVKPSTIKVGGTAAENEQLAKRIAQSNSLLKGGKVVKVHQVPVSVQGKGGKRGGYNKQETVIEYKIGTKTYTIRGKQNKRTGQFNVYRVQDGAPKLTAKQQL